MLARIDFYMRLTLPVLVSVLLVVVAIIPTSLSGFATVSPTLVLASLYYWAIYRPESFPFIAVFGVGVFEDMITGAPLGVNAALYLVSFAVVAGQRRFFIGKSFVVVWWGFSLVACGVAFLQWVVLGILAGALIDAIPGAFAAVSTIAAYPLLSLLFSVIQRIMPESPEYG